MKTTGIVKSMALIAVLCSAAIALAQDVHYNYDRDTNFSAYKTYQWSERGGVRDQLMDKDIRRAVDDQLAQKGLQRVETGGDLVINYQTGIDRERQADVWTMGPRFSGMARANTSTIEIGTLVVNMLDAAKKQLVWRGSATKTLNINKDPDKNYKNLEKSVAKLLRNYPPKARK